MRFHLFDKKKILFKEFLSPTIRSQKQCPEKWFCDVSLRHNKNFFVLKLNIFWITTNAMIFTFILLLVNVFLIQNVLSNEGGYELFVLLNFSDPK